MNGILKFIIKRICILYVALIFVCFLIKHEIITTIVLLSFSVLFSLLRFAAFEAMLRYTGNKGNKSLTVTLSILIYLSGMAIIGLLIVLSIKISMYSFIMVLLGSFSSVIIIMLNAITEALGITKNKYGQGASH